jgi:hypothetical protein
VLAVGCWHIWDARNDTRNNHTIPDPTRTSARIVAYVQMIVQHCFMSKPSIRCESSRNVKWTPPPPGEVMVNVDAALFADQRRMAMGAVFRDHHGDCLAAASEPMQGFASPELAEALALRRAVSSCRQRL